MGTAVFGIDPEIPIAELSNEQVKQLWSEAVRNELLGENGRVHMIIKGEARPTSPRDGWIFDLGHEMSSRRLFEANCLI